MVETAIEFGSCPPTLNRVGASRNWRAFHGHKKRWQEDIETMLLVGRIPKDRSEILVRAELRFPTRRRRDEGNFRVLLEKSTGDALKRGGWLEDDTPEHYRFTSVTFDPEPGAARTILYLSYEA